MYLKTCFFILTLCQFTVQPLFSNPNQVVDRLVVKIDKESYAQSEVESYIKVKQLYLSTDYKQKWVYQPEKDWTLYLSEFIDDRIIYNESLKSYSRLSQESTAVTLKKLLKKAGTKRDDQLDLDPSNAKHNNHLRTILKTQGFISSRNTNRNTNRPFEKEDWFNKVKEKHTFRYFNNSKKYFRLAR